MSAGSKIGAAKRPSWDLGGKPRGGRDALLVFGEAHHLAGQ